MATLVSEVGSSMTATHQGIDHLISHLEAMQGAEQKQTKAMPARSHWRDETTGFPDGASVTPPPRAQQQEIASWATS